MRIETVKAGNVVRVTENRWLLLFVRNGRFWLTDDPEIALVFKSSKQAAWAMGEIVRRRV